MANDGNYTDLGASNGMVAGDGSTPYKRANRQTPPIDVDGQKNDAPDTSPNVAITRDQDRRKKNSSGSSVEG